MLPEEARAMRDYWKAQALHSVWEKNYEKLSPVERDNYRRKESALFSQKKALGRWLEVASSQTNPQSSLKFGGPFTSYDLLHEAVSTYFSWLSQQMGPLRLEVLPGVLAILFATGSTLRMIAIAHCEHLLTTSENLLNEFSSWPSDPTKTVKLLASLRDRTGTDFHSLTNTPNQTILQGHSFWQRLWAKLGQFYERCKWSLQGCTYAIAIMYPDTIEVVNSSAFTGIVESLLKQASDGGELGVMLEPYELEIERDEFCKIWARPSKLIVRLATKEDLKLLELPDRFITRKPP
jgi:hypothetical protein